MDSIGRGVTNCLLRVATLCGENEHVVEHECVACPLGSTNEAGSFATADDTECIRKRRKGRAQAAANVATVDVRTVA